MDIGDLVLQTANTPGTATFNLIPPVAGRVSFVSGPGPGAGKYYIATDGTNWEKGDGTVTAGSPDTLSRDHVIRNSLGTTAKINFTSTVTILSDIPAERAIYAVADNGSVAMAARAITGLGAAFAADHAPRFDQVRWTTRTTTVISSSTAVAAFALPSDCARFRLEIQDAVPAALAGAYVRFSFDGGTTYASGSTDYGATLLGTDTVTSYAGLSPAVSTSLFGTLEFQASGSKYGLVDTATVNGTTPIRTYGMIRCGVGGTATNILFGFVGQNITIARLNLLGAMS